MQWFPPIYAIAFLPCWLFVSGAITIVHTIEESAGEIWSELGIPAWAYFGAQLGVVLLGCAANLDQRFAVPFIVVRVADVAVTHVIFRKPGLFTAPLLVIDALVIALVMEAK